MTLSVRRAHPRDAGGIAAAHVASWQQAYRGLLTQDYLDSLSVQVRTQTWEQNLSRPAAPGVATLIAELDGRIIGFASTGPSRDDDAEPDTGELWGLYLHPDHWGAGHGHTLHAGALAALSSAGATTATLWVLTGNERARRFYEQHGWVADGAKKTDWRGDVRLEEVRYRCALSADPDDGGGDHVPARALTR
jgi:GNAT superfamily N-acetyltransferase